MLFLLAAALSVDPGLMDRFDNLSEQYVSCYFSTIRAARADHVPLAELKSRFQSGCEPLRDEFHPVFVNVLVQRGRSPATAQDMWQQSEDKLVAGLGQYYPY